MQWLDVEDPQVRSAVVSGNWGSEEDLAEPDDPTIDPALQVACDLLTSLTAGKIHPAGIADEEFRSAPGPHRLTPSFRPLRQVLSVTRITDTGAELDIPPGGDWRINGHSVVFRSRRISTLNQRVWDMGYSSYNYPRLLDDRNQTDCIRLTYEFGSTVTQAARRAVLIFAHELWLEANPDQGECALPERTTSVSREGLSYTILDPQEYLTHGGVGLPAVDLWISSVNPGTADRFPSRALRPSGVWTPNSPPAVNTRVTTVRPLFPVTP